MIETATPSIETVLKVGGKPLHIYNPNDMNVLYKELTAALPTPVNQRTCRPRGTAIRGARPTSPPTSGTTSSCREAMEWARGSRAGVRPSATLDPLLAKEGGIPLTDDDATAIIAVLRTLTEEAQSGSSTVESP